MNIDERISKHRIASVAHARLCRILNRVRDVSIKLGVAVNEVRTPGYGLVFECQTEADAVAIGRLLQVDVKLAYSGGSVFKMCGVESGEIALHFAVKTKRPITLAECVVTRRRSRSTRYSSPEITLSFKDVEIVKWHDPQCRRVTDKTLPADVWEQAKISQDRDGRLKHYVLIDDDKHK